MLLDVANKFEFGVYEIRLKEIAAEGKMLWHALSSGLLLNQLSPKRQLRIINKTMPSIMNDFAQFSELTTCVV